MAKSVDDGDTLTFDTGVFLQLGSGAQEPARELIPPISTTYDVDGWPINEEMALQILEERRAVAQPLSFLRAVRRAINRNSS